MRKTLALLGVLVVAALVAVVPATAVPPQAVQHSECSPGQTMQHWSNPTPWTGGYQVWDCVAVYHTWSCYWWVCSGYEGHWAYRGFYCVWGC